MNCRVANFMQKQGQKNNFCKNVVLVFATELNAFSYSLNIFECNC